MSWKDITASLGLYMHRFLWGMWSLCAGSAYLAAVGSFGSLVGWQAYVWLQSGNWPSMPLASYGLPWIGSRLGFDELTSWGSYPQTWTGAHKILDLLSVGVTLGILFMLAATLFAAFERAARNRVRELEDRARNVVRERTRYLGPE